MLCMDQRRNYKACKDSIASSFPQKQLEGKSFSTSWLAVEIAQFNYCSRVKEMPEGKGVKLETKWNYFFNLSSLFADLSFYIF